jgi:hypothetical protein
MNTKNIQRKNIDCMYTPLLYSSTTSHQNRNYIQYIKEYVLNHVFFRFVLNNLDDEKMENFISCILYMPV